MLLAVPKELLPSALIRSWLQWHERHHRLKVPGFAKEIGATPAAVHNWISGARGNQRGISEKYWAAIARFFGFTYPEELLSAARAFHAGAIQASGPGRPLLEHPATPALIAEYRRESDAATSPRRPQRPAHRATARKSHGRP